MSFSMMSSERKRVDDAAKKLGVYVPGDTGILVWPIIHIEALIQRIESLEERVRSIEVD